MPYADRSAGSLTTHLAPILSQNEHDGFLLSHLVLLARQVWHALTARLRGYAPRGLGVCLVGVGAPEVSMSEVSSGGIRVLVREEPNRYSADASGSRTPEDERAMIVGCRCGVSVRAYFAGENGVLNQSQVASGVLEEIDSAQTRQTEQARKSISLSRLG
jgi:hypothetical protein